jgi:hypothetical protein
MSKNLTPKAALPVHEVKPDMAEEIIEGIIWYLQPEPDLKGNDRGRWPSGSPQNRNRLPRFYWALILAEITKIKSSV